MARAQKDQLVACTASGETWWQPDSQISFLLCLRCPTPRVWLVGCFFLWLPKAVYTCLFMLPQDALFTKMEHITAKLWKKEKKVLTGRNTWNKWMKRLDAFEGKWYFRKKRETSGSNMFSDEEWLWSTLLLKHNKAAALSTFFSFRRPLIGSVELQNWVYSS